MDDVLGVVVIVLFLIFWATIIMFFVFRGSGTVKTVKAQVCDKYKYQEVTRYPGTGTGQKYVVVFKTQGGKLSFDVSSFSYSNYRVKKKGTLKYKGSQIISFK